MPVPKKRRSISKRRTKHAVWKIEPKTTVKCKNCGEMFLPHTVCPACGYYNGKKVMVTATEKSAARKEKKKEQPKQ